MITSLIACTQFSDRALTLTDLQKQAAAARSAEQTTRENMIETLAQRIVNKHRDQIDILLLSGGGEHAAYGIGFLRGWQKRADSEQMPTFDLVTGVSAGALLAPFTVVGTAQSLNRVASLFLEAISDFAPSVDWTYWLFKTGGVADTRKYEKVVGRAFDENLKADVVSALDDGRQLVLGTADFDLGAGKTWNITTSLLNQPQGLDRFRQLMLATTSLPGVFPSRVIDGHVHSDGGIISNVMPVFGFEDYERLGYRLKELRKRKARRQAEPKALVTVTSIHLWVIVNLWTPARAIVANPANKNEMAQRGSSLLFASAQSLALQRLSDLTRAVSYGAPGLKMDMHFTAISPETANDPNARENFNKDWMTKIEALGRTRAASANPWNQL